MNRRYRGIKNMEKTDMNWRKGILRFACCDCGLVHDISFVVKGNMLRIRMLRNNRATGQTRRHLYKNSEKSKNNK